MPKCQVCNGTTLTEYVNRIGIKVLWCQDCGAVNYPTGDAMRPAFHSHPGIEHLVEGVGRCRYGKE